MLKNIVTFAGGVVVGAYVMHNTIYKRIVSIILANDDDETEQKASGKEEAESN